MKINVTLPFDRIDCPGEFDSMAAVQEIGGVLERAGFHGGNATDHPAPTGRWLDAGGHHAQDPFVMLSLLAGATTTLRLKTSILVLPYRNPLLTARAASTLDVFSGGRVVLGVGAGYLKGEYRALGADFDKRNEVTDEYLRALIAAWSDDEFSFEAATFSAQGVRILPRPLQKPYPPLYIGGNSRRAIRRAVEFGDVWNPFLVSGSAIATTRTAQLASVQDVAEAVSYLREYSAKTGRQRPLELAVSGLGTFGGQSPPEALLETIGRFAEIGVSEGAITIAGQTRAEWCDNAARFGETVIARVSA